MNNTFSLKTFNNEPSSLDIIDDSLSEIRSIVSLLGETHRPFTGTISINDIVVFDVAGINSSIGQNPNHKPGHSTGEGGYRVEYSYRPISVVK